MNQLKWKKLEFSRTSIIKAGKAIKKENISYDEEKDTRKIIDNWRASHAFPLHIIYVHLRRMTEGNSKIIVAERLKRLDSIISKLKREPNMSLWSMQDLGGCRVIVPTVDDVYKFSEKYEKSRKRHILRKTYDYIQNPKSSGYRSLHRVYQYKSDKNSTYNNNMLIEIQYRTHLQHIWATAVETMGLFTKEAIKSGQGSDDVRRFFALISNLFAMEESQPLIPEISNDKNKIINEIKHLNSENNYLDRLSSIKVAVDNQEKIKDLNIKNNSIGYCILILNYNTKRLRILYYLSSEFEKANKVYNSIESAHAETKIDAVLVRVSSFKSLKAAYPNYFSDIENFINKVKEYLTMND